MGKYNRGCKVELDHIAAMLSRFGGRGYHGTEEITPYGQTKFDSDPDPDSDKIKAQ